MSNDQYLENKELKVALQTDVTSYLGYSLPLSIITAHEKMAPWYYQHFVQLSAQIGRNGFVMLDYVEPFLYLWDIVRLVQITYDRLGDGAGVLKLVKEQISREHYVFVYIDEFYILVKVHYQKEHFVHESMVYGYDEKRQKLLAIGLGTNNVLSKFEIDYQLFIKAFENGKIHYKDSAPYAKYQAVELFMLSEIEDEFPFDWEFFLGDLHDYLHSVSRKNISSGMMPPGESYEAYGKLPVVYGIDIYDLISLKLRELLEGKILIDFRAIHLFTEHKRGMYQRLKYITTKYGLDGAALELLRKYEEVVRQIETVRLKTLKLEIMISLLQKGRESLLKSSIELISSVKEQEKSILEEFYGILKLRFNSVEG